MRAWLAVASIVLLLVTPVLAQNISINGGLSSGFVELKGKATDPPLSALNRCKFYANSASDALLVSCNGGAYRTILGTTATSCTEAADGTLTCNRFVSTDQDPTAANAIQLRENTVDRTCAANGVAGQLMLLDTLGTLNKWCWCNGNVELQCLPTPVPTATPTLTPTPTPTAT